MERRGQITLLSETDIHGTIIFANDEFCRVSKYSRPDLIGKPHNIIRHPDMPKELFYKLWSTIVKGNVFKGIIKNRAGDGSHYWVNATIIGVRDQRNAISKFVAVRHLIESEKVAKELFDAQMKDLELLKRIANSVASPSLH